MTRTGTHKYNTRSSTKRVKHVTTFKNTPNVFKMDAIDTFKTHIGTDYIARIDPKRDTITVEPLANNINCETTVNYSLHRPSKDGCTSMDQLNVQQTWPPIPGLEITFG